MSLKPFLEKISRDWLAKVVCFALALVLYIFFRFNSLDKKTMIVPVEVRETGSMTAVTNVGRVKAVKVTVRAHRDQLATISESDFHAYVDISDKARDGTYSFPVLIEPNDRVMLMEPLEIGTKPDTIELTLEEKYFRQVPVRPVISGTPLHGYHQAAVTVVPSTVLVRGPRGLVESLKEIPSETVSVEGAQKTFSRDVHVVNDNAMLTVDTQTQVRVGVQLVAAELERSFTGIGIAVTGLAEQFEAVLQPSTLSLSVEGAMLDVEAFEQESIRAEVDCSQISEAGKFELPLVLNFAGNVYIAGQSVQNVSVEVKLKPVEEESVDDNINTVEEVPAEDVPVDVPADAPEKLPEGSEPAAEEVTE